MNELPPPLLEDDEYIYVPEEFFAHLPPEYRAAAEERRQQGSDLLQIADKDIRQLIRLTRALPTASSLRYIFHRLRTAQFDTTAEALMEQEMLTTAFVVTYSRLFLSGNNGTGVSRDRIPSHLRKVHDEILAIRNNRYAHNGGHDSADSGIEIQFDGSGFRVHLQMTLVLYVGGRNEWDELAIFLDGHMHERINKILERLKDKTGFEWSIPTGPTPSWIDPDQSQ